jgi:hypothetical protein
MRKAIFFHGYGGEPISIITEIFKHLGYEMIQPHIDFDEEWDFDKCKSLFYESIDNASDCDLIIGLSLGGYLSYLVANSLGKDCILINPGIDRSKTLLHIKEFDCPKLENNCNLEIFLGDRDYVIPNRNTISYLDKNIIKTKIETIKGMEHVFSLEEFIQILKISSLVKKN